ATFGLSLAVKGMIGAAGGLAKLIGKALGKKAKALPNTAGNNDGLGKLDYYSIVNRKGENAWDHVMTHEKPTTNPNKKMHTVFRKHPIRATNAAWKKRSMIPPANGEYVIPTIGAGTLGENAIKIVVIPNTNKLVTAYPVFIGG
ncbi:MAG: hypothetical protein FWD82_08350, partial [Defluviitaleaceae bacterium]|nr:hypothetical protein [Defluviitaleaceae bacterium]